MVACDFLFFSIMLRDIVYILCGLYWLALGFMIWHKLTSKKDLKDYSNIAEHGREHDNIEN